MDEQAYQLFDQQQKNRGINMEDVKEKLKNLKIETPSWGYGDSGTRFNVFHEEGVPTDAYGKIAEASRVHQLTGAAPAVALHIPWDQVDNFTALKHYAQDQGVTIGAINPNLFQDDDYKLGSLTHHDEKVRNNAVTHMLSCIDIAREVDSKAISLWLADGTNYPGQGDFRKRKQWLQSSLEKVYGELDSDMRLLIEYKFFEPAFYHTDLPDWGMAYDYANKLGNQADVLVDTGHHPQGTNIEHIVSYLLDEKKLGGFHFNNRKYADDDLMVGAINPYEIFLTFYQISDVLYENDLGKRSKAEDIIYMLDQAHNIEAKTPAIIQSILNVQRLFAKSLLINREEVAYHQNRGNVLQAERAVRGAFELDVTPLLHAMREEQGLPVDPFEAYMHRHEAVTESKGGSKR
ncbi:L-rhamnose isomerase [Thalassobacillus sp. CUG 92003]|uniref:L-rhamnose isomerase n=1 Tax=Thalassobacillus sp. CUG 92003 TaxID=2736641 RepID=UPI0021031157|nr:L-rhamnose isomerase [Thalassobacillus sp. CUG 92003]